MNRARGFTLIELMITIAILAIISAFAIPAYNSYIRESRLSAMRMNLDTLRIAVEAYRLDSRAGNYGTTKTYDKAAITSSFGWIPEGDNSAYDYRVRVTSATTYQLCAARAVASDQWVRCTKGGGNYACTEGAKGSSAVLVSTPCP
jgi:type IV pilus assembly protein PilE